MMKRRTPSFANLPNSAIEHAAAIYEAGVKAGIEMGIAQERDRAKQYFLRGVTTPEPASSPAPAIVKKETATVPKYPKPHKRPEGYGAITNTVRNALAQIGQRPEGIALKDLTAHIQKLPEGADLDAVKVGDAMRSLVAQGEAEKLEGRGMYRASQKPNGAGGHD